jgi:Flp pilus assembly protein TadG
MIRCRRLWRLCRDTEGQALLETVIVFPVLLIFVLVVMELSMLYNGKQLANYAAFCAARTASVYGKDSTMKTQLAAAMAMSSIASANNASARQILIAYGLTNPDSVIAAICSISGFQGDNAKWLARLANAYVRTSAPACTVATAPGKTRRYVVASVTYIYRCNFWPFGIVFGQSGVTNYYNSLPSAVKSYAAFLLSSWHWNIAIRGRAVTDYWAG